ncbi:MAG: DUF4270 domain-containing protein [Cryomorphaceae bacterium]|jgi:hypothetical protein|nr:DUF4270 domain-containing protein [Cryomorphaceae bacterium]MBT6736625.1 DUF4270 domain-containing protein [Cryomorphaceae bacterium]MBT7546487.1 DUF4270 domain-containing protein [Cryomorphaceae bacterium]
MHNKRFSVILLIIFSLSLFTSCNKDYYSVGIELLDQQFQDLKSETFPIFSYQESLERVQTNNLSNVHLGVFNDDFFGQTNSGFISQLNVALLETFGEWNQNEETEGSLTDIRVINEQEELTAVYLDLPFYNNTNDSDGDGVIDAYDADPNNVESDSDNDGLSDIIEFQAGINPLSNDSDNDGILDPDDTDNSSYNVEQRVYEIDSVFGNRNAEFDLKVYELTYYLSSLDPANNFESLKEYFSDDDFYKKGYYGKTLHDDRVSLDFNEVPVLYNEDDPTTDPDELTQVNYFETPRIRIPLDTEFFQRSVMNLEGSEKIVNQANFNNFFKGIIVRAENFSDDLYMMLDIFNARIVLEYNYNSYNTNGTDDISDDSIDRKKTSSIIPLGGVTINLYDQVNFDQKILTEVNSSAENIPSEKIYLNGSKFISKLKLFSDDNSISDELSSFMSKNVLINEANIVLHLDDNINNSSHKFLPERLYIYSYDNGDPIEDYNKDFSIDFSPTAINSNKFRFGGMLQYDSNNKPTSYKFNITNHVSNIVRYDSLNIDLGLTTMSNIDDVFTLKNGYLPNMKKVSLPSSSLLLPFPVALFGSSPDQANLSKRIKLEVLYTEY